MKQTSKIITVSETIGTGKTIILQEALTVDLFAGGGGASEGIRMATGTNPDVAINHDPVALAMHKANHPDTWHLMQDIWEVSPRWATKGRPVRLLWASPDCKHFSKAKGSENKSGGFPMTQSVKR